MTAACPDCGFDGSSVSPADAAVALRSFPRRYRAILIRPQEEDAHKDPARRAGAAGWSALDHAAWAAAAIDTIASQVRQVLIHDAPDLGAAVPPIEPPSPPGTEDSPDDVIGQISAATDTLAGVIEGAAGGDDWTRTAGGAGGHQLTSLDLVRLAVHQGVHHLRAADKVLQEVVGRP
jgi:hypothetical protein